MCTKNGLFCLLLAVMLAGGNMAFSAHASSHSFGDSGLCALCVHAGSPDTAIVNGSGLIPESSTRLTLTREQVSTRLPRTVFHAHHCRAPPSHI